MKKKYGLTSFILKSSQDSDLGDIREQYQDAIQQQDANPVMIKALQEKLSSAGEAYYHCKALDRRLYLTYRSSLERRATKAIEDRNDPVNLQTLGTEKRKIYEAEKCYKFSYKVFNDRCTIADGLEEFLDYFELCHYDPSLPWELFNKFNGIYAYLIQRRMEGIACLCERPRS